MTKMDRIQRHIRPTMVKLITLIVFIIINKTLFSECRYDDVLVSTNCVFIDLLKFGVVFFLSVELVDLQHVHVFLAVHATVHEIFGEHHVSVHAGLLLVKPSC